MTRGATLAALLLMLATQPSVAQTRRAGVVTPNALARLRDIGGTRAGISVSPSGRSVLYNLRRGDPERNAYTNQWMLLDLETKSERVVAADAGPPLLSYGDGLPPVDDFNQGVQSFAPVWSTDEQSFYYVRKDSAGIRLYSAAVRSGRSEPVALPVGKVTALAPDAADRNSALVTLEVAAANAGEVVRRRNAEGVLFTGNEFAPVLGIPVFTAPTETTTLRIDLRSGATSVAPPPAGDPCAAFPGWPRDQDLSTLYTDCSAGPDGRPIAIGFALSGQQGTALYTATDRKARALTPRYGWLHGPPAWHDGTLYYVAHDGYATSDVYAIDRRGRVRPVTHGNWFLRNCVFRFDGAFSRRPGAICTAETLAAPRELARVDLRDGRVEILTDLNPGYNALRKQRTVEVDWRTPEGDALRGTLTYPIDYDSTRRYPVIVTSYPHPGFTRGSNGDEFPIPVFAADGFLVLDVAAPASHFWTALDIPYRTFVQGYASPLRALDGYLRRLAAEGRADLDRVGICGLSGGANFSAYAVSHSPLFKAAIFDWHESDYLSVITLGREGTRQLYARRGLGPADTANWRDYSLGHRAAAVKAAVLLNVADRETFFALGTHDALKASGKPVEMWVYPDAHHVKWQPGQRLSIYQRNADWFNYWLRGVRDPDPAKAAQYDRWAKLPRP